MDNEQPNKTDTQGKEADKPVEKPVTPVSEYDKTLALVARREEATKKEEEVLERKEKLAANSMLGGTSGGHIEPVVQDPAKKLADEMVKAFN